jgi:hypothetical protein
MTVPNWTWIVAIEGVTLGNSTRPTGFSLIADPGDGLRREGAVLGTYVPLLVPGSLRLGSQEINVLAGDPPAQSFSVSLLLTPELYDVLFEQPEPIGVLDSGLAADDGSFDVVVPTGTLEGVIGGAQTTLWIGREAFVGTASGNTFTIVGDVPRSLIYPDAGSDNDLARSSASVGDLGHLFTRIEDHPKRSASNIGAQPDDRVFAACPILRGRRIYLYRGGYAAGEWVEQLMGQYILSDDLEFGADAVEVTLTGRSLIGTATSARFNTRAVTYRLDLSDPSGALVNTDGPLDSTGSAWARPDVDLETVLVPVASQSRAFLTQGQVGIGSSTGNTYNPFVFPHQVPIPVKPYQFGYAEGLPPEFGQAQPSTVTFNELLVSDPTFVLSDDHHPYYDGTEIQQNPLIMVLQHFGEHPSNLPDNWVYRIGPDSIDVDSIEELSQYFASATWPGIVAGGDGKSVPALSWLASMFLRPLACGWAVDQHGRLTIRSLLRPEQSLASITQSNTLYGRGQRRSLSVAAEAVRINIGQGGGDSPRVIVNALDAYLPDSSAPLADVYAIDGRGYLAADTVADGLGLLAQAGVILARAIVNSLGEYLRFGPVQSLVKVNSADLNDMDPDAVQSLLPGDLVEIQLIGLRGRDNVAVQGIVIASTWAADFTTRELRVLVFDIALRRWSAAVEIATVTDNGDDTYTLTFTATDTVTPLPYDYSTDLATLQDQFARGGATLLLCDDKLLDRGLAAFDGVDTITTTAPLVPAVGNWLVLADLGDVPVAATRFGFLGRDKWGI